MFTPGHWARIGPLTFGDPIFSDSYKLAFSKGC